MSSKILTEVVFVGSAAGSSVNRQHCFVSLARAATEKVGLIATLIVVSAPLWLVAALSIVVISCHLDGARLAPRHFKLLFRVLVTKARNVSDFLF